MLQSMGSQRVGHERDTAAAATQGPGGAPSRPGSSHPSAQPWGGCAVVSTCGGEPSNPKTLRAQ